MARKASYAQVRHLVSRTAVRQVRALCTVGQCGDKPTRAATAGSAGTRVSARWPVCSSCSPQQSMSCVCRTTFSVGDENLIGVCLDTSSPSGCSCCVEGGAHAHLLTCCSGAFLEPYYVVMQLTPLAVHKHTMPYFVPVTSIAEARLGVSLQVRCCDEFLFPSSSSRSCS